MYNSKGMYQYMIKGHVHNKKKARGNIYYGFSDQAREEHIDLFLHNE